MTVAELVRELLEQPQDAEIECLSIELGPEVEWGEPTVSLVGNGKVRLT